MVPVLMDDWLYMDVDGHVGTYGREETQRNLKGKIKSVTAAFIDCEIKIINTPHESAAQKEALINAAFSNDYLVQEERLSTRTAQIIAASKIQIQDIYNYFTPVPVTALVPYSVGIRAYLKSKSLWSDNKIIIFIDDLKTQAIITIMEGLRLTPCRRISMRDAGYMASEIKRSQQNYLAQRGSQAEDPVFMLVSNNREWLTSFMNQGIALRENMLHVDAVFPVLEGLKTAKFGMHFALPEDLVDQKRKKLRGQRWKSAAAMVLTIIAGVSMYLAVIIYRGNMMDRLAQLQLQQKSGADQLAQLYRNKFRQVLRNSKTLPYARIYYDFVEAIPEGYRIKEFDLVQNPLSHWRLNAMIFPFSNFTSYRTFSKSGRFASAKISDVFLDKKLGQRIEWASGQGD